MLFYVINLQIGFGLLSLFYVLIYLKKIVLKGRNFFLNIFNEILSNFKFTLMWFVIALKLERIVLSKKKFQFTPKYNKILVFPSVPSFLTH